MGQSQQYRWREYVLTASILCLPRSDTVRLSQTWYLKSSAFSRSFFSFFSCISFVNIVLPLVLGRHRFGFVVVMSVGLHRGEGCTMTQTIISIPGRWEAKFKDLNFDIDKYIGPVIPRSRLDRLPGPISHFLGYRDSPKRPIGNVAIATWSLFGGFIGTAILACFFMSDFIKDSGGPIIIGSYVCQDI